MQRWRGLRSLIYWAERSASVVAWPAAQGTPQWRRGPLCFDGAHVNAAWQDSASGARKQLAKATPLLGRATVAWPPELGFCILDINQFICILLYVLKLG
jgi:hypothetical protein